MHQTFEIINQVHQYISQHNLVPEHSKIIVGLSGGPDSVFLLHLFAEYHRQGKIELRAVHLDHQWRPDSSKDVEFCRQLCDSLSIEFISATAADLPIKIKSNGSQEEIGRRMRRYFLQKVREDYSADFIALGHHAQDQQETFFIRLIRGTTLSGLTAMKPKDGVYIRPLLETNKSDIVAYLNDHTIAYLIDPTNEAESFLRNRIRKKVLPALQECDARFNNNFLRTMHNLRDAENFLSNLTSTVFAQIITIDTDKISMNLEQFHQLDPYLQNRVIIHWLINSQVPFTPTETFIDEIMRFLEQPEDKEHHIHHAWYIKKQHNKAFIVHK